MSLDSDLQNIVQNLFATLTDFRTSVTYVSKTASYNTSTGEMTAGDTEYTVNAILTGYKQSDIDGIAVHANDRKALIPTNDLSIAPVLKDQIMISSILWTVIGIQHDPVGALWILQLRR